MAGRFSKLIEDFGLAPRHEGGMYKSFSERSMEAEAEQSARSRSFRAEVAAWLDKGRQARASIAATKANAAAFHKSIGEMLKSIRQTKAETRALAEPSPAEQLDALMAVQQELFRRLDAAIRGGKVDAITAATMENRLNNQAARIEFARRQLAHEGANS